jgi:predicted nucleic acid-binding protein
MLARMGVDIVEVDHGEVLGLAQRIGLTAYDASYLWLARRTGSELVTLDRQLAAAATGL